MQTSKIEELLRNLAYSQKLPRARGRTTAALKGLEAVGGGLFIASTLKFGKTVVDSNNIIPCSLSSISKGSLLGFNGVVVIDHDALAHVMEDAANYIETLEKELTTSYNALRDKKKLLNK